MRMAWKTWIAFVVIIFSVLWMAGCGKSTPSKKSDTDTLELVVITPHNENIKYEFEHAFSKYYKQNYGKDVNFQWRDVGGGSSSILQYLRNVYDNAETSGIDILFGGGEYPFQFLDSEGLLVPLHVSEDVLKNIPATFGGMDMYSKNKTWYGNVLSSFGFLYNKELLTQLNLEPPKSWEDIGKPEFFDLVIMADPTQSGSQAAANEMIVQSAPTWPEGWTKLLMILSNAKKFTDSSGATARAPALGECVVSVCIDFYGNMHVAEAPDKLGYISPKGQTAYTPDPIAILKNPPHPELAQAYVNFLLSLKGQALWALPPGVPDGPERYMLNRTPIRKDFYTVYADTIPEWISRPYDEGAEMVVDADLREVRYGVLSYLVYSAAIENARPLKDAKRILIDKNFDPKLLAIMTRLPENIDTVEEIYEIAEKLKDPTASERITTNWTAFFRDQYKQIQ